MLQSLISGSWLLLQAITGICVIIWLFFLYGRLLEEKTTSAATTPTVTPVSVNFHFTRKCNLACGFCFHTDKSSHIASDDEMKQGLLLLKNAGMRKINFAGGEPFLHARKLAMLCRYCKEELQLESVSIITNGTKVNEKWLDQYGQFIDVLGVSCDSFDERTNIAIGRGTECNMSRLLSISCLCRQLGIKLKINTVVCAHNWHEDMREKVGFLDPFRWKVFQVLYVEGENDAKEDDVRLNKRKRNARKLLISDEQFQTFCMKNGSFRGFVPEPNSVMASSYLILDEYLCFLDKGAGVEKQSRSILEVGVQKALSEIYWDEKAFRRRGGFYDWERDDVKATPMTIDCGSLRNESLRW